LGFRDREVRRSFDKLRMHGLRVPAGTPIEPLLRAALIELRPPAAPAEVTPASEKQIRLGGLGAMPFT
jgi:hypothetical protein